MLKKNFKQEQGRSMVEMLGVLAVIGVLSVAGIAGYSIAMDKYRANELLSEASKRAVVVAAQLAQKNSATLSEFNGEKVVGGTFVDNVNIEPDANGQFTLTINGVSEAVCNQMKNSLGPIVQKMEESCATSGTIKLTFNKDLSTEGLNQEENNCSPSCESTQECVDGMCIKKSNEDDGSCAKNSDCTGKVVDGTTCATGTCYCAISAEEKDTSKPTSCFSGFAGSCALVSEGTAPAGTTYKVSSGPMTWWSATNFCKAVNGSLVSLSDVGCEGDGETPQFNSSVLNGKGYPSQFWTKDSALDGKIGTLDNSCTVFRVYISGVRVDQVTRWSTNLSAICRQ